MKKNKIVLAIIIIGVIIIGIGGKLILNRVEAYKRFNNYVLEMSKKFDGYKMNNANIIEYNKLINESAAIIKEKKSGEIKEIKEQFASLNRKVLNENTTYIDDKMATLKNCSTLNLTSKEQMGIDEETKIIDSMIKNGEFIKANREVDSLKARIAGYMIDKQKKTNYMKLLKANELIDSGKLKDAQDIMNTMSYTTLTQWNREEYNYLRIIMDEKFKAKGEVITH